jgi:hypothetical protein
MPNVVLGNREMSHTAVYRKDKYGKEHITLKNISDNASSLLNGQIFLLFTGCNNYIIAFVFSMSVICYTQIIRIDESCLSFFCSLD